MQFDLNLNFDYTDTTERRNQAKHCFLYNLNNDLSRCWRFRGTPSKNGLATVGNNETTSYFARISSRRVHEDERESDNE